MLTPASPRCAELPILCHRLSQSRRMLGRLSSVLRDPRAKWLEPWYVSNRSGMSGTHFSFPRACNAFMSSMPS